MILIDGGDGIAEALASMEYGDISVLDGGILAWSEAGHTLLKGVNVPSKALGELAESRWHPKTITLVTLAEWQNGRMAEWQKEGRGFSCYDCRPPAEFQKMTVPGAACLPNGEIAHRLPALGRETPIETSTPLPLEAAVDVTSLVYGRHDGDLAASRQYLDWEQGPIAALSPDERRAFRL